MAGEYFTERQVRCKEHGTTPVYTHCGIYPVSLHIPVTSGGVVAVGGGGVQCDSSDRSSALSSSYTVEIIEHTYYILIELIYHCLVHHSSQVVSHTNLWFIYQRSAPKRMRFSD